MRPVVPAMSPLSTSVPPEPTSTVLSPLVNVMAGLMIAEPLVTLVAVRPDADIAPEPLTTAAVPKVRTPTDLVAPWRLSVPVLESVVAVRLNDPLEVSVVPGAMSSVPAPVKSRPEASEIDAVVLSVLAARAMSLAASPSAESDATCSVPAFTGTLPVNVLTPPSTSVPGPAFVRPPEPASTESMVVVTKASVPVVTALSELGEPLSVIVPPEIVYPVALNVIPRPAVTVPAVTLPAEPPKVANFAESHEPDPSAHVPAPPVPGAVPLHPVAPSQ